MKTLIFSFLFAAAAVAQNNTGAGYYAFLYSRWPVAKSLEVFEKAEKPRISVLWNTWGTDTKNLERFLKMRPGVRKQIQIHTINEVCARNKRCSKHEFLADMSPAEFQKQLCRRDPKLIKRLREYWKPLADFAVQKIVGGGHECLISPSLESLLESCGANELIKIARGAFTGCRIVWNPVNYNRSRGVTGYDVFEKHGARPELRPGQCLVNLDGEDIHFRRRAAIVKPAIHEHEIPGWLSQHSRCEASHLWAAEFNCIGAGGFTPPEKRTNCPPAWMFDALKEHFQRQYKPVPDWTPENKKSLAGCARVVELADGIGGNVWKQSDVHPGAVAVFHGDYNKAFQSVQAVADGRAITAFNYSGLANPDRGKMRQHWRSLMTINRFPFNIVLRATQSAAPKTICFKLNNSQMRID